MISGTFTAPGQVSGIYSVGTGTRLHVVLEGDVAKLIVVSEISFDAGTTWNTLRDYAEADTDVVVGLPTCSYRLRCAYLGSGSVDWILGT